ncbi:hypothetical protein ACFPRL_20465 [Pseudoclavibacter helvolus]
MPPRRDRGSSLVSRFEHDHLLPSLQQLRGGGEANWPRADDRDRQRVERGGRRGGEGRGGGHG